MPGHPVARFVRSPALVRLAGLVATILYAAFIVWVYAAQPKTIAEVRGGVAATVGAYSIDRTAFDEGLRYFRADQFAEARRALERADPAQRDATTQVPTSPTPSCDRDGGASITTTRSISKGPSPCDAPSRRRPAASYACTIRI